MSKITDSFRESYYELTHKVTWPSWQELISSTILVLVASIIFALLVFVMDTFSKQVLDLIYSLA
ncbi:preprotein translocase subunit SecE [Membranicola marinus]|uniref:Protein translocase subunit SecE n=1 Tax=Membranihabitans marinus TaxID=1227546 RepID=A0A953HKM0_9BACT|nr:preprotein translocase subunit SecE [Membranihabitans marinus]MBY5957624.1 preprotein translocase subunit SecE [Membranihabitans marinus]